MAKLNAYIVLYRRPGKTILSLFGKRKQCYKFKNVFSWRLFFKTVVKVLNIAIQAYQQNHDVVQNTYCTILNNPRIKYYQFVQVDGKIFTTKYFESLYCSYLITRQYILLMFRYNFNARSISHHVPYFC
jgi:hypothetical protein